MQNLTKQIFIPVFDSLKLGTNENCLKCNAAYKTPLLPWIVGGDYEHSRYRLMIVGKPHRGPADPVSNHAFFMDEHIDWLSNDSKWPYWKYSREIAQRLYGNDGINQVVLTNIVKCTNTETGDTTTREMMDCCVCQNAVIWREVTMLKPLNIVFYTYNLFSEYLKEMPFQLKLLKEERKNVQCGAKSLHWWERVVLAEWGNVRILVTGHPERMLEGDYVKLIADWVQGC